MTSTQRNHSVADIKAVTPPRQIYPGQLCFVTVRAVNRCYRFVPTRRTLEIIWYCFARTLDKYRGCIEAHEFLWMSNHYHLVLTDRGGRLPRFMEELNSLLARALNALHGIQGTTIEKGYNLVVVASEAKLAEHCIYTLANPCSANLVERCHQWQGVSSRRLEYGAAITIVRPKHGLWGGSCRHTERSASQASKRASYGGRSKLPEEVSLVLTRPPIMLELSDAELRNHIREQLHQCERALIANRRARKWRVMGWAAATKVSCRAAPAHTEERFGTVPSYSADTKAARISAWERRRDFLERYYAAWRRFVAGEWAVIFPAGTWMMKVRFGVTCCPLPAT
jgi:putative transposase